MTVTRALVALVWAGGLVLAVGDRVPTTESDIPLVAAALLASYPVIDVIASVVAASRLGQAARLLRINAAVSAVAAVAIAVTAFASDAGAALAAFGVWAAVSGALQFGVALHRRRVDGLQVPLLISGGLSTLAGLSFLSAAGMDEAHLAVLGGYMAFGAVLFLASAALRRARPLATR